MGDAYSAAEKLLSLIKSSTSIAVAIAIGGGATFWLVHAALLPPFPLPWMPHAIVLVSIIAGLVAVFGLSAKTLKAIQGWQFIRNHFSRREQIRFFEAQIPYLTPKEREIIGYLLHHNMKVLECTPDGGYASTLISRRFLNLFARPNQQFDHFRVPFQVNDIAWELLEKRREEFPYNPSRDRNAAPPWRERSF